MAYMMTSLGQQTTRLRMGNVKGRKFTEKKKKEKKNKVEEIQLVNLARPSQAKILNHGVCFTGNLITMLRLIFYLPFIALLTS